MFKLLDTSFRFHIYYVYPLCSSIRTVISFYEVCICKSNTGLRAMAWNNNCFWSFQVISLVLVGGKSDSTLWCPTVILHVWPLNREGGWPLGSLKAPGNKKTNWTQEQNRRHNPKTLEGDYTSKNPNPQLSMFPYIKTTQLSPFPSLFHLLLSECCRLCAA